MASESTSRRISWFGFEGDSAVVDGLWKRPVEAYIDFLANDPRGFNALRLPLAYNNIVRNPTPPAEMLSAEPDALGLSHLQILELVVQAARGAASSCCSTSTALKLGGPCGPTRRAVVQRVAALIDRPAARGAARPALLPPVERLRRRSVQRALHGGTPGTGDGATDWDTAAERSPTACSASARGG